MQNPVERDSQKRKKPYVKPTLMKVQLKPEEAILGACKKSGFGPAASNCISGVACQVINS
jgi:hypothetical protein